jgi:anaerobic ribonucleoside-triphosphate reductase activating protein
MKGWQKTSFIDYPDRIATVFFFGGCNFRCAFCHNPDLVLKPESLPNIDDGEVLSYIEKKKHLYEGVCISGGEPTLYPGIDDVLQKIKAMKLEVKLDTNGAKPDKVRQWIDEGLIHYVAMDVKTSPEKYSQVFQFSSSAEDMWSKLMTTIKLLKENRVPYEFRSTIYPPFFEKSDWSGIRDLVDGAPAYYLQPYNPKVTLAKGLEFSLLQESELAEMRDYFAGSVGKCEIR